LRGSSSSLPTRARADSDAEACHTVKEKAGTQATRENEEEMQEEIKRLKEDLEMV